MNHPHSGVTITGLQVAAQMLAVISDTKTFFMSGCSANIIAERGVMVDAIRFIQKPFDSNQLADCVSNALKS